MPCMSTLYITFKLHEYHSDKDFLSFTALTEKKSVSSSGSSSDTNAGIGFSLRTHFSSFMFSTHCLTFNPATTAANRSTITP